MITLKGKSRHGKNRINQHGKLWIVQDVRNFDILLRSKDKTFRDNTFDIRTVNTLNDPDFIIET